MCVYIETELQREKTHQLSRLHHGDDTFDGLPVRSAFKVDVRHGTPAWRRGGGEGGRGGGRSGTVGIKMEVCSLDLNELLVADALGGRGHLLCAIQ